MFHSRRTLENNNITGGLSSTWGAPGVFQSLAELDLSQNWNLDGILLSQWGGPGAFPLLQVSLLSTVTAPRFCSSANDAACMEFRVCMSKFKDAVAFNSWLGV